jgi:hypothetical protein
VAFGAGFLQDLSAEKIVTVCGQGMVQECKNPMLLKMNVVETDGFYTGIFRSVVRESQRLH